MNAIFNLLASNFIIAGLVGAVFFSPIFLLLNKLLKKIDSLSQRKKTIVYVSVFGLSIQFLSIINNLS